MEWLQPKPLPDWLSAEQVRRRLEAALSKSGRSSLETAVHELFSEGLDEGEVLGALEVYRTHLRQENREADEEMVEELMDRLVGWCAPEAILRRSPSPGPLHLDR